MTDNPLTGSGETNIDVVDKLIWMDTNTLDVALADLCVEARNEIERLRAEVERLRAAGEALASAFEEVPHWPEWFYKVYETWKEARRG